MCLKASDLALALQLMALRVQAVALRVENVALALALAVRFWPRSDYHVYFMLELSVRCM